MSATARRPLRPRAIALAAAARAFVVGAVIAAAVVVTATLGGCTTVPHLPSLMIAPGSTLSIDAGDFYFHPNDIGVRGTGSITLHVTNSTNLSHNLTVDDPSGKPILSIDLPRGATVTALLTFAAPGSYYFYCDHPSHAERGMKGYFTVISGA